MYGKRHSGPSETAYRHLKEQILHLELPPGTAISEIETAAQYDISRTPIRDVFKTLEAEGLLEIQPHIGTFVSLIDLEMISDILYTREALEQAVLKDLSKTYSKSNEKRIHSVLKRQEELLISNLSPEELGRAFILADNEFHSTLFDIAGKKNIADFFFSVSSQYERFRTFINRGGREYLRTLYEDHMEIFRCIREQRFEELTDRVSHHIYDGFHASASVVAEHPEYFKTN